MVETTENLAKSLSCNSFIEKNLSEWDLLYDEFQVHICPKIFKNYAVNGEIDLANLKKRGVKYTGCFDSKHPDGVFHNCQFIPIIVGTRLDIKLRGLAPELFGNLENSCSILNCGFFSYIPNIINNNVKTIHKFMGATRIYLYDGFSRGWMLEQNSKSDFIIVRNPQKRESNIEENPKLVKKLIKSHVGIQIEGQCWCEDVANCGCEKHDDEDEHETMIDFDHLYEWFRFIYRSEFDIDSLENKFIFTGASLIQTALYNFTKMNYCQKNARVIKTKITSGNLYYLISRISIIQTNMKDNIRYMIKSGDLNAKNTMFQNIDNTRTRQMFNHCKRLVGKNSKYLENGFPKNIGGLISLFYYGSVSSAGKNMNFTFHTRTTFVRQDEKLTILDIIKTQTTTTPSKIKLVFQSIPLNHYINFSEITLFIFFLKSKFQFISFKLHMNENTDVDDVQGGTAYHYLHIIHQSGLLQRPVCIDPEYKNNAELCVCGQITNKTLPFNENEVRMIYRLKNPFEKCHRHIWLTIDEIFIFEFLLHSKLKLSIFDCCCDDLLELGKFNKSIPISKLIVGSRTNRLSFIPIDLPKFFNDCEKNTELTNGYLVTKDPRVPYNIEANKISLFSIFYDFEGRNVEDGYCLGSHVNLPIILTSRNTFRLFTTRGTEVRFVPNGVLTQLPTGTIIEVCKIFTNKEIKISEKRFKVIMQKVKEEFCYTFYINFVSYHGVLIDEKSINVDFYRYKNVIVVILIYQTIYEGDRSYNLKLSNKYGQKGMARIVSMKNLVRENGKLVDLTINPISYFTRKACTQFFEMNKGGLERVYHNGVFIGYGGYCQYFLVNAFPSDNIHNSTTHNRMRMDKLTYHSMNINNTSTFSAILNNNSETNDRPNPEVLEIIGLTKCFNKILTLHQNYVNFN